METISLGDAVYQHIKRRIEHGEWGVDQRLPSEGVLADEFAVSRPILRQALTQLRAEGFINSVKGSGHYVKAKNEHKRYEFGALNSVPDVRLFLEFRCFLECEITAIATARHDAVSLHHISQCYQAIENALKQGKDAIQEDIDFHMAIAKASGNRFFISTLEALIDQIRAGIRLVRELADRPLIERFEEVNKEHTLIITKMKQRDIEGARKAMRDHLTGGIRRLFGSEYQNYNHK